MGKRNRGCESEVIAVIVNVFCYAYSIEINGLGLYNLEPVYIPNGDENNPSRKILVDHNKLKNFLENNFGIINYNEFVSKLADKKFAEKIVKLLNLQSSNSFYKSDFYRGNLGISVKNYGMSSKKWDLKTTDISIMNRGTFNSFLECANRISKDEEMKRLYDEYGVLDDKYKVSKKIDDFNINPIDKIVLKNQELIRDKKYSEVEENISRIYKDFLINIKNGKFPLNCSNYKVTTKEYGYFYPIEIWKYVKPMIVYFAYKGTYTGDSFNIANCMMEITNPYDISTYRIYYDFNEYVEKHRCSSNFEIRGISKKAVQSYFSRIPEEVLFEMGIIKMKEKTTNQIKFYGMGRTAFKLTTTDRKNR